ncbi:LysR family transcriptional regulator [Steroidobacter agaridevorans]|uniref:LysR family transcriptional regulator n=1 Tax=Steroidobacter agaridevorans TaxID=2695856 RepID=A0A829YI57_9GAMM|nr:LysR family transcriptional regulator [Steroidobacter agaridevorans]GFE82512.1 LysR family transcriptional regulator [Steroidobacter agaridevorans]
MLDNLTLDQMRVFAAVAEAGSFRAGAQRLHRVQSAVSHAISNLESELRVQLFDRSVYKPTLTAAGRSLLAEVRAVLAKVDGLRARARELQEGLELVLSIAVDTMFPLHILAQALRETHARYPSVDVRIECASLGGTVDALLTKRCMVAVAVLDWQDDRLTRQFVMPLTTVAVVAPGHPLSRLPRKLPEQQHLLSEHFQIVLEDKSQLTRGKDFGVLSPRTWKVDDMHVKLALLRAGVGWGTMPRWLVEADLKARTLIQLPASALGPGGEANYHAYLSHRTDQALGPAARAFASGLAQATTRGASPRKSSKGKPGDASRVKR